jgi:transposase
MLGRLQIQMLLSGQVSESRIRSVVGCHFKTVATWRKRLNAAEGIQDRQRSGRPATIPPEVGLRVISFYCQRNPLPGCSRWSLAWAHEYLEANPDVLGASLSRSSLHRLLNAHALKPHKRRYFLQICDPLFFEKMERIIALYQQPPEYLFCLDECTGVQALERVAPALPGRDKARHLEFEYIRHGAVSFLSILRVATGKVFTECIDDHKSGTISGCIKRHVHQQPISAQLHYIADNYSSHSTEEICQTVAELSSVPLPKLDTATKRREWLGSPEKRIIFHFLPTHGSWLNLVEIWFMLIHQKAIKDVSVQSKAELREHVLGFSETWDDIFCHPFHFSYTGDGLHEKVLGRFTTWLQMESSDLSAKFLGKQLNLIANMANSYWAKVISNAWKQLAAVLQDKNSFLKTIINDDQQLDFLLQRLQDLITAKLAA